MRNATLLQIRVAGSFSSNYKGFSVLATHAGNNISMCKTVLPTAKQTPVTAVAQGFAPPRLQA